MGSLGHYMQDLAQQFGIRDFLHEATATSG
jgi:hypothetical protein